MTALVTGATSGIGRAIAEQFAASGAQLLLTGRNRSAGSELAARLGARFLAGDITDPEFPDRLISEALSVFGRLDILINNAGITHRGSVLETSDADWAQVMERERHGGHALLARRATAHGPSRQGQYRQYRIGFRRGRRQG